MAPAKKDSKKANLQAAVEIPPESWEQKFQEMQKPVPYEQLLSQAKKALEPSLEERVESESLAKKLENSRWGLFLKKVAEKTEEERRAYIEEHKTPARSEDAEMWRKLPLVPGPNGGPPIPRKAIKENSQMQEKFFDFFRQHQFGLWGYRQKPYPITKPNDIQQVLGSKWLDWRYYDFAMRSGNWFYKDRLGRTRGPCELINLKTAWSTGIIDKNTFVWGDNMDEFAPIGMVYGLQRAIDTPDVKFATAGTAMIYKIGAGMSPWSPLKGHEKKGYKQLQREAIQKRDEENTILAANKGIWPGEASPFHTLFMWAGGPQLTQYLDRGKELTSVSTGKFIPYELRKKLAQVIPGLRPWEVQDVEAVMDFVTYAGSWHRQPLGHFTMRHEYEEEWQFQEEQKLNQVQARLLTLMASEAEKQEKERTDKLMRKEKRGKNPRKNKLRQDES